MPSSNLSATIRPGGGKAAGLLELRAGGFCVPEFVVSPDDLAAAVRQLGTPLVVRSSASLEDGQYVSFAGQFTSYLGLNTLEEVRRAVQLCFEAVESPQVIHYCRRSGLDPQALQMDVIVQRMVQPELAGVAFTVNPLTGVEEVVIEACEGVSEQLLAGRESPLPAEHPLVRTYRSRIAETARRIQAHFGAPQDVEFAIENGHLYVLQARPITRIGFPPDIGEWTNADFRDGGVSSTVCSPLMWSLYEFVWERTLKTCLRELRLWREDFQASRLFFGRPYWNVGAVKHCLARLPGFVEREFDQDLSVEIRYSGDGLSTPVTPLTLLRALPSVVAIHSFLARQRKTDEQFLNGGFDDLLRAYDGADGAVGARDEVSAVRRFGRLIEHDYFVTESHYFRTIFAASLAKLDFTTSFPEADYGALVGGLPPLRYAQPLRLARELGCPTEVELQSLVHRFRHNYCRGLDVYRPRWDEDVQLVMDILRQLPTVPATDPRDKYETTRAEALTDVPRRKQSRFLRKLEVLRHFVWLREEMRDLSNQMYYHIRRLALEISRYRGLDDDIFFMTFQEILRDDRAHIATRREVYAGYRNFQAPPEIGHRYPYRPRPAHESLRGIAASPGMATGTVFVAHDVEQAARMAAGQVLVCPFTDPGWTLVLDRAAAVVSETGGLLSHAAVICREYGIPAVLAVPDATHRIQNGSRVTVRGSEGWVDRS